MKILKKKNILFVYTAAAVLLITGTFMDLSLSDLLYDPDSLFGRFFLLFGQMPIMASGVSAAAMLSNALPEEKTERLILILAALCGIIGGFSVLQEVFAHTRGMTTIFSLIIVIVFGISIFFFVRRKTDGMDPEVLKRTAFLCLLVIACTAGSVFIVKRIWARPRYRSIIVTSGLAFKPWYQPGRTELHAFEGILSHEEFYSFPSAHTASAASALCLIPVVNVMKGLRKYEKAVTFAAFAWIICTALARIIAGAHFLSDVTCGFLTAFSFFVLFNQTMK